MRTSIWPVVLVALGLAGCQYREYEIELTPHDGKLERRLTASLQAGQGQPDSELAAAELSRIAAAYGQQPPPPGGPKHTFSGKFVGRMPQDVGGHGTYIEWRSEFGTTRVYVERFRGDDDLVRSLDARRVALNRLADLLVGWSEVAWENQPERTAIRRFLDQDLRRDLVNVSYYLKALELSPGHNELMSGDIVEQLNRPEHEPLFRAVQYLVERQYVALDELPKIARIASESSGEHPSAQMFELLQTIVRRKIGVAADEPLPNSLALLGDPTRLLTSLNKFLRDSREYQMQYAQWSQTPLDSRPDLPPEPVVVLSELIETGLGMDSKYGGWDKLELSLHVAHEPTLTNGDWDSRKLVVRWRKLLTNEDAAAVAPALAYAAWAVPDDQQQERRFGRVRLTGESLIHFCLWRSALTPNELRQWELFVATLEPGPKMTEQIEAFRFDGEPEETDSTHRSQAFRDLLDLPSE